MGKEKRPFCCHQKFVPNVLSAPARGYIYMWKNMQKTCIKSGFKEIVLKLATNGQSDKGFLLTSTFVPKGLSAPALGLYTCIKALNIIPGPGVRWAFTGPLVLWFQWREAISIATYTAQLIVTSIFGLCVKRKRMVRERDCPHAFCFLFSDTDRKNRCPAKSWRDLQSLEIDINLNWALKVPPEPK